MWRVDATMGAELSAELSNIYCHLDYNVDSIAYSLTGFSTKDYDEVVNALLALNPENMAVYILLCATREARKIMKESDRLVAERQSSVDKH